MKLKLNLQGVAPDSEGGCHLPFCPCREGVGR